MTSVRQIAARAGVSRRRFYELFDNSDDCFAATFEEAITSATERAAIGYRMHQAWTDRLRAALFELLDYFDSEPELAKLAILYTTPASPAAASRAEVLARLAQLIDEGGRAARGGAAPSSLMASSLVAEAVVGGAWGILQSRLLEAEPGPLTELVNPLMSVIVLPYIGREAALRELSRPVGAREPAGRPSRVAPRSDPLAGLAMRLTYRTLRVLAEVAASPGISNREVAEAAGVRDAGQISKLLTRVEGLGLVRNTGGGQAKGAANAWVITERGAKIDGAVGPRLAARRRQPGVRGRVGAGGARR
jgi:AcrR family transcriptional regulator